MRGYFFALTMLLWVLVGILWLLPRKLRLMRRLGNLTPHEIIQRGKDGDIEAKTLHRDSTRFVITGLALLLPQILLRHV